MKKSKEYPSVILIQPKLEVVSQLPDNGRVISSRSYEKAKASQIKWRLKNAEKVKGYRRKYNKKYCILKKDELRIKKKEWELKNKEKRKLINKRFNLKNKSNRLKYLKNKKQKDPLFKLICDMRSRINHAMKRMGYKKNGATEIILGTDYINFKKHIEKQFKDGMDWSNSGKWHYDHIIPISSAKTEEDVIRLNHYTNFQPLWAAENMKKGIKH